jgi:hypothetical protein
MVICEGRLSGQSHPSPVQGTIARPALAALAGTLLHRSARRLLLGHGRAGDDQVPPDSITEADRCEMGSRLFDELLALRELNKPCTRRGRIDGPQQQRIPVARSSVVARSVCSSF